MEDFVTYEQAVQLKELGFDYYCNHYYHVETKEFLPIKWIDYDGDVSADDLYDYNPSDVVITEMIMAPTLAQVQKWFREKHYLSIEVYTSLDIDCNWEWDGFVKNLNDFLEDEIEDTAISCKTYEEALSKCIDKGIEILTNENK